MTGLIAFLLAGCEPPVVRELPPAPPPASPVPGDASPEATPSPGGEQPEAQPSATPSPGGAVDISWSAGGGYSTTAEANRRVVFPADSGVVDVTRPPYGAVGDGKTDVTAILQKAIADNIGRKAGSRILYFPAGTYVICAPLVWQDGGGQWKAWLSMQGENKAATVIRLADNAADFQDPQNPRAMLRTGSAWKTNTGNGNQGFANYFNDLTISTGSGNPGAIGLDYLANNDASINNLTVRSEDGSGHAGIVMNRPNSGPYLVKNTTISGFEHGIVISNSWYSHVFEYLVLENICGHGVWVRSPENSELPQGPVVAVRRLTATGCAFPVVKIDDPSSLITLVDARVAGSGGEAPVIVAAGEALLVNAESPDAVNWIACRGASAMGARVDQFVSRPPLGGGNPQDAWQLPVEETPFAEDNDFSNWANVREFGADPTDNADDSAAIQRALDSGKSTVYFPAVGGGDAYYRVDEALVVPATVGRLLGFNTRVRPERNNPRFYGPPAKPVFLVRDPSEKPLFIEHFNLTYFWHFGEFVSIRQTSSRPLVVRNSQVERFEAVAGAGGLFLESVIGAQFGFAPYQSVWARHLNPEGKADKVLNNAGRFWCFGIKGEQASALLTTVAGGRSEVLGGLFTASLPVPEDIAAFTVRDSANSLNFVSKCMSETQRFSLLVEDVRDGAANLLFTQDAYRRPWKESDAVVPLYVNPAAPPVADALVSLQGLRLTDEGDLESVTLLRAGNPDRSARVTLEARIQPFGKNQPPATHELVVDFPAGKKAVETNLDWPTGGPALVALRIAGVEGAGKGSPDSSSVLAGSRPAPRDPRELVLHLDAGAGVAFDETGRVAAWGDLSPQKHAVDFFRTNRRPGWAVDPATGRAGILFADDVLAVQKTEALQGRVFPEKSIHLAFNPGADIQSRQILYKQGAKQRGLCLYIHAGRVYAGAWNLGNDGGRTPWGPVFLEAPLRPNAANAVTWVLRGNEGVMELFVNGRPAAKSAKAGPLHPHGGGPSYFGLQQEDFPMHDRAGMDEKTVFVNSRGGYPFKGHLFEFLQYNRALAADEIRSLNTP